MEESLYRHDVVDAAIDAALHGMAAAGANLLEAYQAAKSVQLACAQQMAVRAADTEAFRAALEAVWEPPGEGSPEAPAPEAAK